MSPVPPAVTEPDVPLAVEPHTSPKRHHTINDLGCSEVAAGVTPSPKRSRLDDSFHLETPQRSRGELIGERSMFIGDTLQVEKFIAQINQFSTCSTPNCIGNYKLHDITLGGSVIKLLYE